MGAQLTVYRKLDLATFTGDAWAVDATLATPPADIPRLAVRGPVRWSVIPMTDGSDLATQVVDTVTAIDSRSIIVERGTNQSVRVPTIIDSGNLPAALYEPNLIVGDVVVLALPTVTTGGGSAPWLWVCLDAGLQEVDAVTG